ncbi:30S ribosomal protein S9 [Candidatus Micrarchaeota archaeon]|nr:30S ribosomal protein S9 [Candidatus Micrarchaeota archaeon]
MAEKTKTKKTSKRKSAKKSESKADKTKVEEEKKEEIKKEEQKEAKEVKKKEEKAEVKAEEIKEEKKETKKTAAKKKKKTGKKKDVTISRGKRKKSIARATVKKGKGTVRVNGVGVLGIQNVYISELVMEPVKIAGAKAVELDISVTVNGGGVMGQAQAARTAIAKALVEYLDDESLKEAYMERDRSLLVEDSRRVEPKKYRGPKARARFQKSYR